MKIWTRLLFILLIFIPIKVNAQDSSNFTLNLSDTFESIYSFTFSDSVTFNKAFYEQKLNEYKQNYVSTNESDMKYYLIFPLIFKNLNNAVDVIGFQTYYFSESQVSAGLDLSLKTMINHNGLNSAIQLQADNNFNSNYYHWCQWSGNLDSTQSPNCSYLKSGFSPAYLNLSSNNFLTTTNYNFYLPINIVLDTNINDLSLSQIGVYFNSNVSTGYSSSNLIFRDQTYLSSEYVLINTIGGMSNNDTTPPEFYFDPAYVDTFLVGSNFILEYPNVTDNIDGNLTATDHICPGYWVENQNVDINTVGTYHIYFVACDTAQNTASYLKYIYVVIAFPPPETTGNIFIDITNKMDYYNSNVETMKDLISTFWDNLPIFITSIMLLSLTTAWALIIMRSIRSDT